MDIWVQGSQIDVFGDPFDMNYLLLQKYKYPIVVLTRDRQANRIERWIQDHSEFMEDKAVFLIGWWDLIPEGYLVHSEDKDDKTVSVELSKWGQHDSVIFLDPERASEKNQYLEMIRHIVRNLRVLK